MMPLGKLIFCVLVAAQLCGADGEKILYFQNFSNLPVDKLPDDIIVIDGKFTVRSDGENKFLELAGTPLDTYGFLFGEEIDGNVIISVKIFGESTGKRHPSYCIGMFGINGIKLRVSPGRKAIELLLGDKILNATPFEWKDRRWLLLNLIIRKSKNNDSSFLIEGIVWYDGEYKRYIVKTELPTLPPKGKASAWGITYSSKPIKFDDLKILEIQE